MASSIYYDVMWWKHSCERSLKKDNKQPSIYKHHADNSIKLMTYLDKNINCYFSTNLFIFAIYDGTIFSLQIDERSYSLKI